MPAKDGYSHKYKIGAKQYQKNYMPAYKERNAHFYKVPGVYVWITPDGKADYVGRGSQERAQSHKYKYKNPRLSNAWTWWTPQHLLIFMTCDNEWQAMEYEGKWGQYYQLRYNKEGYRYKSGDTE